MRGSFRAGVLTTLHNTVSYVYVVFVHRVQHTPEATDRRASTSSYLLISGLSAISLVSSNVLLMTGACFFTNSAGSVASGQCLVGTVVDMIVEGRSISTFEAFLMILICSAAIVAASDQQGVVSTHSFTVLSFISSYVAIASCIALYSTKIDLSSTAILHGMLPYSIAVSCAWLVFIILVRDDNTVCSFPSYLWFCFLQTAS